MSNMQVSKDILFLGTDLDRPRWTVEQEKIHRKFSGFTIRVAKEGTRVTSVVGTLQTSYGNSYKIKISIPENYPYQIPSVSLDHKLESYCPHKFTNDSICLMKSEQWSSSYSIAFIISKTAVWLNKYDYWKRNGSWPGKAQEH